MQNNSDEINSTNSDAENNDVNKIEISSLKKVENSDDKNDNFSDGPEEVFKLKKKKKVKKVTVWTLVLCIFLAALLTFMTTYVVVSKSYVDSINEAKESESDSEKLAYVKQLYEQYYVGDIDDDSVVDGEIAGYIYGTGDKYGQYFTAEEYEEEQIGRASCRERV